MGDRQGNQDRSRRWTLARQLATICSAAVRPKIIAEASSKNSSGNPTLGTIEEPAFYGVKLHPTSSNCAGLLTDRVGRVIHQRRHPILGLYATGLAAAHTEYGVGYQAGMSLAFAALSDGLRTPSPRP